MLPSQRDPLRYSVRFAAARASEAVLRSEAALLDADNEPQMAREVHAAANAAQRRAEHLKMVHSTGPRHQAASQEVGHAIVVAWGVYARHCAEVKTFVQWCVGCAPSNSTHSVALIDHGNVEHCDAVTHTISSSRVLPPEGVRLFPADLRYWPRTHALFQLLTAHVPDASWYLKLDTDTFFNLLALRAFLFSAQADISPRSNIADGSRRGNGDSNRGVRAPLAEYVGKEMHLFAYKGHRLVYMQGGGYMLSRRAALVVAACSLGSWRRCPNRVFEDLHDRGVNALMRNSCYVPQTIAEDLYVGTCMRDANISAIGQPCFLTLRAATVHPQRRTENESASFGGVWPVAQAANQASIEAEVKYRMIKLKSRCPCPFTAHPLKGAAMLEWARNKSRTRGCLD